MLCNNLDKLDYDIYHDIYQEFIKIFIHYHDKDNSSYYRDNSKFLDTTVHYTKDAGMIVRIKSNFRIENV